MTNSQRLQTVRAHFRRWLADHCSQYAASIADGTPMEIPESIVIRDEHYCGRCFNSAAFRALWFIEEDELKIINDTGVVAVFHGDEIGGGEDQQNIIKLQQQRIETDDQPNDQDVRRAA